MRVLIATDGSPYATAALRTANRLLRSAGREIDLLCVAPKLERRGYEHRVLREMTQILECARTQVPASAGIKNLIAEIGSAAASIVNRSEDYDLTVIGAKGRDAAEDDGLGPVASRVVEHAMAPVLIAREPRVEDGVRILAAVDGSAASIHAIETLASLFDLSSAEICLIHITETPWVELGPEEDWVTYSDEDKENSEVGAIEQELVREGRDVVEGARELLGSTGASITTLLVEGNPANEILSEAERGQYDLIIVGATGSRDLKHRMLGSVSSKIAWVAPCSVAIVREAG